MSCYSLFSTISLLLLKYKYHLSPTCFHKCFAITFITFSSNLRELCIGKSLRGAFRLERLNIMLTLETYSDAWNPCHSGPLSTKHHHASHCTNQHWNCPVLLSRPFSSVIAGLVPDLLKVFFLFQLWFPYFVVIVLYYIFLYYTFQVVVSFISCWLFVICITIVFFALWFHRAAQKFSPFQISKELIQRDTD